MPVLLFPLLVVMFDHAWPGGLPRGVLRGALFVWSGSLAVSLAACLVLGVIRRVDSAFAARHLERHYAIPHNSVVNAVLLGRATQTQYAHAAAAEQAERGIRTHPVQVLRIRWLHTTPAIAVGGAVLGWLVYCLAAPKPVGPSLARFFGAALPAPTATRLTLLSPSADDIVHAGEPLRFRISMLGRRADDLRLYVRPTDSEQMLTYEPMAVGSFAGRPVFETVLAPHEVAGDLHFEIVAGDGRLVGDVEVLPQPRVTSQALEITPPAYSKLAPHSVATSDVAVLPGSRAALTITSNGDIHSPALIYRSAAEQRTRMRVSAHDPAAATGTFWITEPGTIGVTYTDPWEYPATASQLYRVTLLADAAPRVSIVEPVDDAADVVDLRLIDSVRALAGDDYGITDLAAVYELDGLQTRFPQALDDLGESESRGIPLDMSLRRLGLAPGKEAYLWFEAHDNHARPDGVAAPQLGRSRRLTLVNPIPPAPTPDAKPDNAPSDDGARHPGDSDGAADPSKGDGDGEAAGTAESRDGEGGSEADPDTAEAAGAMDQADEPAPETRPEDRNQPDADGKTVDDERRESAAVGRDDADQGQSPREPGADTDASADRGEGNAELEQALADFAREFSEELADLDRILEAEEPAGEQASERPSAESQRESRQPGPDGVEHEPGSASPADVTSPGEAAADGESTSPGESTTDADQAEGESAACEQGADAGAGSDEASNVGVAQAAESKPPSDGEKPSAQSAGAGAQPSAGGEQGSAEGASGAGDTPGNAGSDEASKEGAGAAGSESESDGKEPGAQSAGAGDQPPAGGEQGSAEGAPGAGDTPGNAADEPTAGSCASDSNGEAAHNGDAAGPGGGAANGSGANTTPRSTADPLEPAGPLPPGSTPETSGESFPLSLRHLLERGDGELRDWLEDTEWRPERVEQFTRAFETLRQQWRRAQAADAAPKITHDHAVGDAGRQRGRGRAGDASEEFGDVPESADDLALIAPPPDQHVAPELQPLLDAYYKSLAKQRAPQPDHTRDP